MLSPNLLFADQVQKLWFLFLTHFSSPMQFHNKDSTINGQGSNISFGSVPNSTRAASTKKSGNEPLGLLIVVAKDKEEKPIRDIIEKRLRKPVEKLNHEGIPLLSWLDFDGSVKCHLAFLNGMGFNNITTFVDKLLQILNPHFITTVGVCGGLTDDIGWAHIFNKATILAQPKNKEVTCSTGFSAYGRDEVWRPISVEEDGKLNLRRPRGETCVLTITDEKPPKETPEELKKRLLENGCAGQDMEIAAIWQACDKYDPFGESLKKLAAVKAVSDDGSEETRDKNFVSACETAWWVLYSVLKQYHTLGLLKE